MTNLNSLKKEIKELKVKQSAKKPKLAFWIFDEYVEGNLSYDEAMKLLDSQDWAFGQPTRVLIQSDYYSDEEKREMLKKEKV